MGKGRKSLEDTTWDVMGRFKKGGAGKNLKLEYQIRFLLLVNVHDSFLQYTCP